MTDKEYHGKINQNKAGREKEEDTLSQEPELSALERKLLTLAQQGLPLTPTPYADLGERFGLTAAEVTELLKDLKKRGLIRRLGGVFSSRKLGWQSLLLAARVPEERFYQVANLINQHPGVTHNYRRNQDYNMWFTLSVGPEEDLQQEIARLEEKTGLEFLQLPKIKQYKLGVKLDLDQGGENSSRAETGKRGEKGSRAETGKRGEKGRGEEIGKIGDKGKGEETGKRGEKDKGEETKNRGVSGEIRENGEKVECSKIGENSEIRAAGEKEESTERRESGEISDTDEKREGSGKRESGEIDETCSREDTGRIKESSEGGSGAEEESAGTDDQGRKLIACLQQDMPLVPRPFKKIADELGWQEGQVLAGLEKLSRQGILKRIAPLLYHRRAGFSANGMVVWQIPSSREDQVGRKLAEFPEVSHCYLRPTTSDWPYNIYAMVHARSRAELRDLVDEMAGEIEAKDYRIVISTEELKKTSLKYFTD